MAKRKKEATKQIIEARKRLAGAKGIDTSLDLGNGLKISVLDEKIDEAQAALDSYNESLTLADTKLNDFNRINKELGELSGRFFNGAASKFGKDSSEYEAFGGTRQSERKRPVRTPKPE